MEVQSGGLNVWWWKCESKVNGTRMPFGWKHSHHEMIVRQLSDVIDKYSIICISLYSQMRGFVVSTVHGPSAEEVGLVCKVNFDASIVLITMLAHMLHVHVQCSQ